MHTVPYIFGALLAFAAVALPVRRDNKLEKFLENDASARPPNLSSASCDLDLWPPDPQSWPFHAYVRRGSIVLICIKMGSFVFKISSSQLW